MQLPEEFITYTKSLFGEERWQRYLSAFDAMPPVSIRINPFKTPLAMPIMDETEVTAVTWCRNAYYLAERPNFTLDPLLHAGAYYVQEASSMFLDTVMQQFLPDTPITMLDLCAAPGGKSTLLRSALPEGSLLFTNEPDRRRANILMENMQKQGHPDVIVTNNFPRDYKKAGILFDAILCDVPCSGEGMFRKDEGAIGEWSLQNVMKCQELQRSIIEDIWPCLREGGLMVYSTCTFNTRENEENVKWIMESLGAEILEVSISDEWNITGSLLEGWRAPVYRFIPGTTCGEGLFMAVLRKTDDSVGKQVAMTKALSQLRILSDGHPVGIKKGKDIIPAHAESLLVNIGITSKLINREKAYRDLAFPMVELSLTDAQRYLHHEALVLPPDTPRGFVVVTYQNLPLGFVKNIGNRANNLYPQEWKIRNLAG